LQARGANPLLSGAFEPRHRPKLPDFVRR
jgi:hypothetical protein